MCLLKNKAKKGTQALTDSIPNRLTSTIHTSTKSILVNSKYLRTNKTFSGHLCIFLSQFIKTKM